jgi:alpha-tubulin suppressor-like RCC1 family protein
MPNIKREMMGAAGVPKGEVTDEGSLYGAGAGGYASFGQSGRSATSTMSDATGDSATDWTQLHATEWGSAGIRSGNTLWTWGRMEGGQGDRNLHLVGANTSIPTQVGSLTDWSFISGFNMGRYAVKTNGTLWAFGRNNDGQVGDGTTTDRSSPVQIGSGTNWASTGGTANGGFGIKTDGTLWSWGSSPLGEGGRGNTVAISSPDQVGSLTNWAIMADGGCGGNFAHGVKTDNTLWTMGYNHNGRLGRNGAESAASSPVQVGSLTNWGNTYGKVAQGNSHSLNIKTDGTLWAWGSNEKGQLGDGTVVNRSSPVQIGSKTDWVICAGGVHHSMAINDTGQLWGWGNNTYGSVGIIGDGTTTKRSSPVQIGTGNSWGEIVAGYTHSIGFRTA